MHRSLRRESRRLLDHRHIHNAELSHKASLSASISTIVLTRASEALHAHAHIVSHDLTEAAFAILDAIYHKGWLLLGEFQKKILVSSGGITFLIDKLEKRGLVRTPAREWPTERSPTS